MKTLGTLLTSLLGICWLAQGSVVRLDVATDGDVTVEIDPSKQFLKSQDHGIKNVDSSRQQEGTRKTNSDEYDVKLPYEVHRGFLSVSLSSIFTKDNPANTVQDDSSYLKFGNIPFAEPPLGDLRFKAPIPPKKEGSDLNEGLEERVCPQYQAGWVPKAFDFLSCFAGALSETCSFKDNWTDPIGPQDYEPFPGGGFVENCEGSPSPLSISANIVQPAKIACCLTYSSPHQHGTIEKKASSQPARLDFGSL